MRDFLTLVFLFITAVLSAQVNYIYSDGSSNNYNISETQIKYDPVTKENSSSGTYSGGEAKIKALSKADFEKVFGINATGAIVNFASSAEYNNPFKAHQAFACFIRRSVSGFDMSCDIILKVRSFSSDVRQHEDSRILFVPIMKE